MTAETWEDSPKGMSGTGRNVSSCASYTYTTSKSCKRRCINGGAPLCRSKHELCEQKSAKTLLCSAGREQWQWRLGSQICSNKSFGSLTSTCNCRAYLGQNTSNDVDVKNIDVHQLQIVCAACVSADCTSHLARSWCNDRSRIP